MHTSIVETYTTNSKFLIIILFRKCFWTARLRCVFFTLCNMKREIPKRPDEIIKQRGRTSLALGLYYFHYLFGYSRTQYQIHFPSAHQTR